MHKDSRIHGDTAAFCSYIASLPNICWGYTRTLSTEMSRNTLIEDHIHNLELSEEDESWTHVFFIDTDVVPNEHCLDILLSLDADVCVGLYPLFLKNSGFVWSVSDMEGTLIPMEDDIPKKPFEVSTSGAGCLLVRREVFEDINWPWFKVEYQPKWANGGEAIKRMEDMYFFDKVKDSGYKIIAAPSVICEHHNQIGILAAFAFARALNK